MALIGKRGGRGKITKARIEADWQEALWIDMDMKAESGLHIGLRSKARRDSKRHLMWMHVVHTSGPCELPFSIQAFPADDATRTTVASFYCGR